MKNKIFIIAAVMILFTLCLFGCGETQTAALPDLGINWDSILPRITEEKLAEYGLYADVSSLGGDANELGSVTFCNYDPAVTDSFKTVDYQLTAEYGLGYEFENGKVKYYDGPVYSIWLVDNNSDKYFSCTYDQSFNLISEEGEWFLEEDKNSFLSELLKDCSDVLFTN